ncbi:hypothetical protein DPSP01_014805 [Paraphaeosphaeria sporulosa]
MCGLTNTDGEWVSMGCLGCGVSATLGVARAIEPDQPQFGSRVLDESPDLEGKPYLGFAASETATMPLGRSAQYNIFILEHVGIISTVKHAYKPACPIVSPAV